ncbi:MAG: beta-ketoacyl-[acyl-carrier-protein] synthase II [Phycisphaerae bacterium]|nr:beta-ketoacyl-[acyl-carrier-protein] synthase II [Phycisphaerae bacterium]|tara:strand:+ start:1700 stop:2956 length:1257 start_codon:yes stop_codon:yes gene_type:complete
MSVFSQRRVVITGLGAISNLGHDVASTWSGMLEGRSCIGPITAFEQDDRWPARIAGEVHGWDPTEKLDRGEIKKTDRFAQLGIWAAVEAMEHCGLDWEQGDSYRRGVVIGSGVGGIQTIENFSNLLAAKGPRRLSPFTVPKLMVNAAAGNTSIRFNLRGVNSSPATACATGGHALAEACMFIAMDQADFILAGGAEGAVSPVCVSSFSAMKALSTRNDEPSLASRPFDRDRDGFVLSEGAAVLAVEELEHAKARGANILAEIIGFGITGDAGHIAAPDAQGAGAQAAMTSALCNAQVNPDEVDYINAHGTSTPLGDAAEVHAVKSLFGGHAYNLAISSTKSCTGHTLGAAGGLESIAVVKAITEGVMPPTINLDNPDEGFDLNFVANTPQERDIKIALNNSFGFGGHNVSLAIAKFTG